jgi:hypothetical protein
MNKVLSMENLLISFPLFPGSTVLHLSSCSCSLPRSERVGIEEMSTTCLSDYQTDHHAVIEGQDRNRAAFSTDEISIVVPAPVTWSPPARSAKPRDPGNECADTHDLAPG